MGDTVSVGFTMRLFPDRVVDDDALRRVGSVDEGRIGQTAAEKVAGERQIDEPGPRNLGRLDKVVEIGPVDHGLGDLARRLAELFRSGHRPVGLVVAELGARGRRDDRGRVGDAERRERGRQTLVE